MVYFLHPLYVANCGEDAGNHHEDIGEGKEENLIENTFK